MRIFDLDKHLVSEVIKNSFSYIEILKRLELSVTPRNRKDLKTFIENNNISINHFDFYLSKKKLRKYKLLEKICPCCNRMFITSESGKRSKETCSRQCSNKHFSHKRMTDETANKIKCTLLSKPCSIESKNARQKICEHCQKRFVASTVTRRFCSNLCASHHRSKDYEYRLKCSETQKRLVSEGKHKGWKTRNILSYPEKYFVYRLDQENLTYKVNFPISKQKLGDKTSSCYFLDFYFEDLKVNLEIDGKQHDLPERKSSDEHRDKLLSDYGITVFRIKWVNPCSFENKEFLDKQFQDFLTFIRK
jgi:very-short-patch-repair endonuclease